MLIHFKKILKQSNKKPNKIWVDKGSEFYNTHFKEWLQDNDIVIYLTHCEGKSVFAGRFIKTIKNKICKYITLISKNVYIDKLDDIVNKYSNTYHRRIKMKSLLKLNIIHILTLQEKLMITILILKLVIM